MSKEFIQEPAHRKGIFQRCKERHVVEQLNVIVPTCGITFPLGELLRRVRRRLASSITIIMISSNSISSALRITGRFRSRTIEILRGRGNKINSTHGLNVRRYSSRCV